MVPGKITKVVLVMAALGLTFVGERTRTHTPTPTTPTLPPDFAPVGRPVRLLGWCERTSIIVAIDGYDTEHATDHDTDHKTDHHAPHATATIPVHQRPKMTAMMIFGFSTTTAQVQRSCHTDDRRPAIVHERSSHHHRPYHH